MEEKIDISRMLDSSGRIEQFPKKKGSRTAVLEYLADKFEEDRAYREKEVNEILEEWHTFGDFFLLRRELIEHKLLNRKPDGSCYWRPKKQEEER
jgi:hypothetical protein